MKEYLIYRKSATPAEATWKTNKCHDSLKNSKVQCKDCKYLMFSDCYGECSKAYKGIVQPSDSCGKGIRKHNAV